MKFERYITVEAMSLCAVGALMMKGEICWIDGVNLLHSSHNSLFIQP